MLPTLDYIRTTFLDEYFPWEIPFFERPAITYSEFPTSENLENVSPLDYSYNDSGIKVVKYPFSAYYLVTDGENI